MWFFRFHRYSRDQWRALWWVYLSTTPVVLTVALFGALLALPAVLGDSQDSSTPTPTASASPTPTATPAVSPLAGAVGYGSLCYDGWMSPSVGRGTCSYHGGVRAPLFLQPDGDVVLFDGTVIRPAS